jgi:hypothetical protein
MKTAISVPDDTFASVERWAAHLGLSRSEFYATAAARWLSEIESNGLTAAVDAALERSGDAARRESIRLSEIGAERLTALTDADEW